MTVVAGEHAETSTGDAGVIGKSFPSQKERAISTDPIEPVRY
jgi:hypothetical protein